MLSIPQCSGQVAYPFTPYMNLDDSDSLYKQCTELTAKSRIVRIKSCPY